MIYTEFIYSLKSEKFIFTISIYVKTSNIFDVLFPYKFDILFIPIPIFFISHIINVHIERVSIRIFSAYSSIISYPFEIKYSHKMTLKHSYKLIKLKIIILYY